MQETFVGRLRGACAVLPGSHVLVAVSGGADSTALLCFFCEIRETYPISVSCAHVEHGIRGAASEGDMRFVKALCEQKNVPFYGGRVDAPGYARAHGCGLEEAARALRYDFLEKTAEAVGTDAIALAHHRGDQAETVLLHAARGSDIRGLCAMRWRRGKLIRPLLDAEPEALRAYLRRIGQPWREDETNACEDYARNRIRRSVLPALAASFLLSKPMAAYQMGESYARSVGVNVKPFSAALVLLSSLLAACVTAFAGPISFVGIAVPHLVKHTLDSAKPLRVLPGCALGGAAFCLLCDLIARSLFAPTELSISSVTAVFGAPVVIWLLVRRHSGEGTV